MNKVDLRGRVVRDIYLKKCNENKGIYVMFPLAVTHYDAYRNEEITDFIDIIAWNKNAKYISENIDKGDLIKIEGIIRVTSYIDKENMKKYSTKVHVEKCQLISKCENNVLEQTV